MSDLLKQYSRETKMELPEFLYKVASLIKGLHPDSTVILFGSFARGDAHEDSDLDICVLVPHLTKRRIDMKVDIRGLICDVCYDNDMSFDIKLYTYSEFEQEAQYQSTLQHTIKTEGVTLSA